MVNKDYFESLYIATSDYLLEHKKDDFLSKREAENRLRMLEVIRSSQLRFSREVNKRIYWEKEFNDKLTLCLYAIAYLKKTPVQIVKKDIFDKAGLISDEEEKEQDLRNSRKVNHTIFPVFILLGVLVVTFSSILEKIDTSEPGSFVTNQVIREK